MRLQPGNTMPVMALLAVLGLATACARPSEEAPPPAPPEAPPVIQWSLAATKMMPVAFFFEKELPSREAYELMRRKFCVPASVRLDPELKVGQEFVVESYRANLNAESMVELRKKLIEVAAKDDTLTAELEVLRYASRTVKNIDVTKLKKAEQKCRKVGKGGGFELECSRVALDQFLPEELGSETKPATASEPAGRIDCSVDRVFLQQPGEIPKFNFGKYEMPDGRTLPAVRYETEAKVHVRCYHQVKASHDARLLFEGEGTEKKTEIFSNEVLSAEFQHGCAPRLYEAREVLMPDGRMIEGTATRLKLSPVLEAPKPTPVKSKPPTAPKKESKIKRARASEPFSEST